MDTAVLNSTLKQLLVAGKGILAADESSRTADKRFSEVGIETTAENRRRYRQLLLTTPEIEKYLSGVIFYDETIRQRTDSGLGFADFLQSKNIVPGIKTDQGLVELADSSEQVSQGLEGLAERNKAYFQLGARFCKWRSVFTIAEGLPTEAAITANAKVLAEYAKLSQANNLIPIVEPEVLLAGDHTIEESQATISRVLKVVFNELQAQGVLLEYTVLKTSMALPGAASGQPAASEIVAQQTAKALKASVPSEVAGVVFLSGGQTPAEATANLNAIARLDGLPWFITFSYSRALQDPVLKYWARHPQDTAAAQDLFATRLKLAALAQAGRYLAEMEPSSLGTNSSLAGQD